MATRGTRRAAARDGRGGDRGQDSLDPTLAPCPHLSGGHQIPIILLDTELEQNAPVDRDITARLYGGNADYRLKQEIVLGIGGERLLHALGFEVETYHLNEGHAALLTVELLRRYPHPAGALAEGALHYNADRVRERCVFTTHTPVEAGHDRFDYGLAERQLGELIPTDQLKLLVGDHQLNMTRLALNLSGYVNGVATRHAETTRAMFPGYRIRAVTNGVHVPTWSHPAIARLFQRIAPDWGHDPEQLAVADGLPDEEVWAAHAEAKAALLAEIGRRAGVELSPDLPLIAFARRITGYKRPDLIFTDLERLRTIHLGRPFQLVVAGKAHPQDGGGKQLVGNIHACIRALADTMPICFVPNYDMALAKVLVAGADIWLNTPLPPLEASGTSGMKAAVNGVLNLSVLDGWWIEAWIEGVTGWAVGSDDGRHENDAQELYDKLEHVVLPLYHTDRSRWTCMMKQAISKIAARFNSQRMMRRYASEAYLR